MPFNVPTIRHIFRRHRLLRVVKLIFSTALLVRYTYGMYTHSFVLSNYNRRRIMGSGLKQREEASTRHATLKDLLRGGSHSGPLLQSYMALFLRGRANRSISETTTLPPHYSHAYLLPLFITQASNRTPDSAGGRNPICM